MCTMTAMRTCKVSWVLGSCSGLLLALGGAAACSAALPAQTGGDSAGADPGGDGPIRVSLSRGPTPIAGASVVSHDAEGAVLATYTTNPSGEVDIPGAGVEMVTVIDGEQSQAYTVVGVKPGDHIVIPTFSVVENLGTLDVTLPTPPTEAVRFHVFVGSDFNDATTAGDAIAVAVTTADIGTQGSLTVLAMAQDANYTIIAVSTATGVMPPAAGTHQALATGAWTTAFNEFHLNVGGGGNIGSLQNTLCRLLDTDPILRRKRGQALLGPPPRRQCHLRHHRHHDAAARPPGHERGHHRRGAADPHLDR